MTVGTKWRWKVELTLTKFWRKKEIIVYVYGEKISKVEVSRSQAMKKKNEEGRIGQQNKDSYISTHQETSSQRYYSK